MTGLNGAKLEIQSFDVKSVRFGAETCYDPASHTLTVNRDEALALVRSDSELLTAELEILNPGDNIRVCPVKDSFQIRLTPFDTAFPGVLGAVRSMSHSGGVIKAFSGCTLMVSGRESGCHQDGILDMSGPFQHYTRYGSISHILLVGHALEDTQDPTPQMKTNMTLRLAGMKLADYIARSLRDMESLNKIVYSVPRIKAGRGELPKAACVLLLQSQMESAGYNTLVYGRDIAPSLPTLLHPFDVLGGGITSASFMPSSTKTSTHEYMTHPLVTHMLEEHGKSIDFAGVIVSGLSPEMDRKLLSAELVSDIASNIGLSAAVLTEEGYGNADVDYALVYLALERVGVKCVGMTCESSGRDGTASPIAVMDPRINAMVSTGNVSQRLYMDAMPVIGDIMAVERDHMPGGWKGSVAPDGHVEMENNYFCSCSICGHSTKSCRYEERDGVTVRAEYETDPPIPAYKRAFNMMLAKAAGESYTSELKIDRLEEVRLAPAITKKNPLIALVTTTGVVPMGNPDGITATSATKWGSYSIDSKERLDASDYFCLHAGFDVIEENANPNRFVPVDAMRALEAKGVLRLYSKYFVTEGTETTIGNSVRMGQEMAEAFKDAEVDGVIFVTSWGTCTRCGSFIAREIERAGIPVVLIASLFPIAESLGVNRISGSMSAALSLGNSSLSVEREYEERLRAVERAFTLLLSAEQSS